MDRARHLLGQAGFALKGTDGPPVDLRIGEKAQLLGFTLSRKNSALHFELGSNAWTKLEQSLLRSHTTENPAENAIQVVRGWITSYGSAFETLRTDTLKRIRSVIIHQGFRELFIKPSASIPDVVALHLHPGAMDGHAAAAITRANS